MNTKHTPGPWKADSFPTAKQIKAGRDPRFISVSTDYPEALCNGARSIAVMTGHALKEPEVMQTNRANARLIAAAPELLEALERLLAAAIHCDPHFAHRWESDTNQARAAIAKATA